MHLSPLDRNVQKRLQGFETTIEIVMWLAFGEQGWGSGESAGLPPTTECDPGSIPPRCHMWVEFAVDSRLPPRIFLQVHVLRYLSLQKTPTISNSSSTSRIEAGAARAKADVVSSRNLVIDPSPKWRPKIQIG